MTDIKRDFDTEAAGWDENPGRVKVASDIAQSLMARVKLTQDMDVMDFGCGTGLLTLAIQPFVRSVTGVDSSSGMLAVLSEKIKREGLTHVKTLLVDLEDGGRLSGTYDLVVSSMTLHHIRDIDALLHQFHGVLKSGGLLALSDLEPDDGQFHTDNTGVFHFGFDLASLTDRLIRAGFTDIETSVAAYIDKTLPDGSKRAFRVFLTTASKP